MGRVGKILVGGLVGVSGPAWAQSLIDGEQLQYNYAYRCNGERVIVAHCRDDDDNSYCQVVYPDRPEVNGNQVAPVEQRGAIVAKLDACTRPKTTSVASSDSGEAPHSNTTPQAVGAPGLAKASWSVLDLKDDGLTLFNKTRIKRTGSLGSGWFTSVYAQPKDYPDFKYKGIEFEQDRYEADCTKGTVRMTAYVLFGDDAKALYSYAGATKWDTMEAGSFGDHKFRVLCGKPQPLAIKTAVVGDSDYLQMFAAATFAHKNGQ